MTDKIIATIPLFAFQDSAGGPASGYLLYTYETGTSTPATTWADQGGTTANTNPIVLDARGECVLWLSQAQEYRLVLKTPGGTTVKTVDDVSGAQSAQVIFPPALEDQSGHSGPLITDGTTATWLDGGMSDRNRVVNGTFAANRYATASPITRTAGQTCHDGWVAGADGVTYSFAASVGLTTVTISAGSLVQTIPAADVPTGTNSCTLSWVGTAQGRIAAGAFADSPNTASVAGGSSCAIEFNTGTVTKVKFEVGAVETPYSQRMTQVESLLTGGYPALPNRYIDGALISVTGGAAISVSAGAVMRESGGALLSWNSAITASGISLSANTFYHVYVYDAGHGVATLEVVTTAPATYQGSAKSKTGNSGRRYLGSLLTGAGSNIYDQVHYHGNYVRYLLDYYAFPALTNGGATTYTGVSLAAFIPVTSTQVYLHMANTNTGATLTLSNTPGVTDLFKMTQMTFDYRADTVLPVTSSVNMTYKLSASGNGAYIYVTGYTFER